MRQGGCGDGGVEIVSEVEAASPPFFVMAGLDPAIHVFFWSHREDVDARVKPGHDEFATWRCD
jgi:hypothetical protein